MDKAAPSTSRPEAKASEILIARLINEKQRLAASPAKKEKAIKKRKIRGPQNVSKENNNNARKKKKTVDDSLLKYGVRIPSFEKILADQKKFDDHKASVKKLDVFDENVLKVRLSKECLKEPSFTGKLLDCKSLRCRHLDDYFHKYTPFLDDVKNERVQSERHQRFYDAEGPSLTYSSSLIVFTSKQKEYLMDLLRGEFDPDKQLLPYLFKVLLPELCLRIFMDVHNMQRQQALTYLDQRPLDV